MSKIEGGRLTTNPNGKNPRIGDRERKP